MEIHIPLRLTVESKISSHIPPKQRKAFILAEYKSFISDLTLYDTIQTYIEDIPNLDDIDINIERKNTNLSIHADRTFTIYTNINVEISGDSVTLENKNDLVESVKKSAEYMTDRLLPDYDKHFRSENINNNNNNANNNANNNHEASIFEGWPHKQLDVISPEKTRQNIKSRQIMRTIQGLPLPENIIEYELKNYLDKPMSETNKNRVRPLPEALSNVTLAQPYEERLAKAEEARAVQAEKNLEAARNVQAEKNLEEARVKSEEAEVAARQASVANSQPQPQPTKKPWWKPWGGKRKTHKTRKTRTPRKVRKTIKTRKH